MMTGPEPVPSGHWQSVWAEVRDDCVTLDLGSPDDPIRNAWLGRIDRAVIAHGRPVVLVAHGLACHAVTWWAGLLGKAAARSVTGALLVAPPDPDRPDADPRVRDFGLPSVAMLPFPSIVVASRDDPQASLARVREMAGEWTSDFFDGGAIGHADASSGLGSWEAGQHLIDVLIAGGPGLSRYRYRREAPVRPVRRQPALRFGQAIRA
jgi:predicted alpha/beta hydrolase family esterase